MATPCLFEIFDYYPPVEGYDLGNLWNGWSCPAFPKASADAIVATYNLYTTRDDDESQPCAWFDDATRSYHFFNPEYAADGAYATEVHPPRMIDGIECWTIGACAWCWSVFAEQPTRAIDREATALAANASVADSARPHPTLDASSSRGTLMQWLKTCDPNGEHTRYTLDTAWEAVANMVAQS